MSWTSWRCCFSIRSVTWRYWMRWGMEAMSEPLDSSNPAASSLADEANRLLDENAALRAERDKHKIDSAAWEEAYDEVVKERDALKVELAASEQARDKWKALKSMLPNCACTWEVNPDPDDQYTGGPFTDKIESLCAAHQGMFDLKLAASEQAQKELRAELGKNDWFPS